MIKKINFCEKSSINKTNKKKIFSRNSCILDCHIGKTLHVHNGKSFIPLLVSKKMKGFRFGDFCFTRKEFSHKNKK